MDPTTKDLQDCSRLRSIGAMGNEKHLAIGCKDGTLRIVDLKKWQQIKLIKHSQRWIQEIRYSPDDSKVSVGAHDQTIYIYDVSNGYKLLFRMKKHSSFITHLDWSLDGNYLHSNCGAYELLFWNANSG